MKRLPVEIIYNIMDFSDPFDIVNFSNALMFKSIPTKYDKYIDIEIENFCDGNSQFMNIIKNIIYEECLVDRDLFNILKQIVNIVSRSHKYMDILGFTTYIFHLHIGLPFIAQDCVPIIYMDTKIINIHYPNICRLKYYLERYMNFKQRYLVYDPQIIPPTLVVPKEDLGHRDNKHYDQYNIYKIKKYNLRHLLANNEC